MREILFRGKRIDNGEWVEGVPIKTHIGTFIVFEENPHYCGQYGYMEISELAKVFPETVGEYTGLTDKNGKKVFEGDIVCFDNDSNKTKWSVVFGMDYAYGINSPGFMLIDFRNAGRSFDEKEMVIIGNIHDNPELLEGDSE